METAIYVRVSTEEQAQEGFSVRAQEQKLKDYARIKEWSIYNIYIDEGISGKNIIERPAVKQMIEDVEKGLVKNVVVFKIDRLTRSTADLAYLIELFNNHNCAFNSLMESIDTHTASGRMFIKIIGIFAEFERENIAERVRLGFERKAKEGYSISSFPSYGYDRDRGQKIQTINEEESKIVKEIFEMFVNQNKALNHIARILNTRGIPTKNDTVWRPITIRQIISNCNYIGKVRYSITDESRAFIADGVHEAIIEEQLFKEAQNLLEKNKKVIKTKKPRPENYYLGFLYCPNCGDRLATHGNYYPSKKEKKGTYRCSYICKNSVLDVCKGFGGISHRKIDKAFEEYIRGISNLDKIIDLQMESQKEEKQKFQEILNSYNSRLQKLKNKENEILNLYINETIKFEEYREMKNKIEKDKIDIQMEIDELDIPEEEELNISKKDIIVEFNENWIHLTDIEKRQFLMKFIKRIDFSVEKPHSKAKWTVKVENVEFM